MHSVEIRGLLGLNLTGGTAEFLTYRIILFQWKDDTIPTVTDILTTADVHSAFNHDKKIKRKLLYETTGVFIHNNVNALAVANRLGMNMKKFINLKSRLADSGVQISFQAGTTTGVNKIYYMLICDDAAYLGNAFTIRINYTDI